MTMRFLERSRVTLGVCALAAGTAVGAIAFGGSYVGAQRGQASTPEVVAPAAQIFFWSDELALLDTTNGAVYTLRGDLDNASSEPNWRLRVAPVDESSGYLQLQRAEMDDVATTITRLSGEIFLVDRITGRTWVLRERASTNGTWDVIERYH
jgi:hypothetical protein